MKSLKNIWTYLMSAILILLIIHPLYEPGVIVFSDLDFGQPAGSYLQRITGLWNDGWSTSNFFNLPRLPWVIPPYLLSLFANGDGMVFFKSLLSLILITAAWSFLLFEKSTHTEEDQMPFSHGLISVAGAIFYALNPWVITRIQHLYLLCGYALFPFFLRQMFDLFLNYQSLSKKQLIVKMGLLGFTFSASAAAIHYILYQIIAGSAILFSALFIQFRNLKEILFRAAGVGVAILWFSFFWIAPYAGALYTGQLPTQYNINTLETLDMFSRNASLINVLYDLGYWWPMLDLADLPSTFYIGGSFILTIAIWGGWDRQNKIAYLVAGITLLFALLATGTYHPVLRNAYQWLVQNSGNIISSILREPNKLAGLYQLGLALLLVFGLKNAWAALRLKRGANWMLPISLIVAYTAFLQPYHSLFINGYYAPNPLQADYRQIQVQQDPNQRVLQFPMAESMVDPQLGFTIPAWNIFEKNGQIYPRATSDTPYILSATPGFFQYEGSPLGIRSYYTYIQSLLDEGQSLRLGEILSFSGASKINYRQEYPAWQTRQSFNLEVLDAQPDLVLESKNNTFTTYSLPITLPEVQNLHSLIYTPYGYDVFDRYTSLPHFDPLSEGIIFISQQTSGNTPDLEKIIRDTDYIELRNWDDLLLNLLSADNKFAPFDQLQEADPRYWSKTYLGSSEWLWYLHNQQITHHPFDLDYGSGVIFSLPPQTNNPSLPLSLSANFKENGVGKLYMRALVSQAGGALQVKIAENTFYVSTYDQTKNSFIWLELGDVELTEGVHPAQIQNLEGFNAVNLFAFLPKDSHANLHASAESIINKARWFATLDAEQDFTGTFKTQTLAIRPALVNGRGIQDDNADLWTDIFIPKNGSFKFTLQHGTLAPGATLKLAVYDSQGNIHFEETLNSHGEQRMSYNPLVTQETDGTLKWQVTPSPVIEISEIGPVSLSTGKYQIRIRLQGNATSILSLPSLISASQQPNVQISMQREDLLATLLPNSSNNWQAITTGAMDVSEGRSYLISAKYQASNVSELHAKVRFTDLNNEQIKVIYLPINNEDFEHIVDAPSGSSQMFFEILSFARGPEVGEIRLQSLQITPTENFALFDMLTVWEAGTSNLFDLPALPNPEILRRESGRFDLQISSPNTDASLSAIRIGQQPSPVWQAKQAGRTIPVWGVNATASLYWLPLKENTRIEVAWQNVYILGLWMLALGIIILLFTALHTRKHP